jgi:hypothetical protein
VLKKASLRLAFSVQSIMSRSGTPTQG